MQEKTLGSHARVKWQRLYIIILTRSLGGSLGGGGGGLLLGSVSGDSLLGGRGGGGLLLLLSGSGLLGPLVENGHSLVGLGEESVGGLDEVEELVDVHLKEHTGDLAGKGLVDGGDERVESLTESLLLLSRRGGGKRGRGESRGRARALGVRAGRDTGGGTRDDGSASGDRGAVGGSGDARADGVGAVASRERSSGRRGRHARVHGLLGVAGGDRGVPGTDHAGLGVHGRAALLGVGAGRGHAGRVVAAHGVHLVDHRHALGGADRDLRLELRAADVAALGDRDVEGLAVR